MLLSSEQESRAPLRGLRPVSLRVVRLRTARPAFLPHLPGGRETKGKIKSLENHRTLYDSIALSLAIYPLLIFYFTIITAPMTLYVAIRYWNAPRSIVHRTKIRYIFAIIIATLQIVGWGVGIYFLVTAATRRHG